MKPTRYFSKKQESGVAKRLGGRTVANSGATLFSAGDVKINRQFLLECKTSTTPKQSFSIKKEWLEKLNRERFNMGQQHCALVFNFGPNQQNYYVINEDLFKLLLEEENDETDIG